MATTVKGTEITNIESSPITAIDRRTYNHSAKISIAGISAATTSIDETADVILLCPVPAGSIIDGVYIKNDDLDSNGTPTLAADVGLYYSGIGGTQEFDGNTSGTEIDVDAFGSAVTTLQAANVTWTEVTNEAGDITNYNKEAWEVGGLSTNPGGFFYVGLKITTAAATAAAGDIVMKVEYRD